jgi:5-methylcytosine-specific restriction endonuclease McrA
MIDNLFYILEFSCIIIIVIIIGGIMSDKLEMFKQIIRECDYDNTYKMAWARSLVEISYLRKPANVDIISISLEEIAEKYVKYYWDQTIFFNLVQGSNPIKAPVIVTYVKDLIKEFRKFETSPILFERAFPNFFEYGLINMYHKIIKKSVTALKENVSWRFYKNTNKDFEMYSYKRKDSVLYIDNKFVEELKNNDRDLYDLINYRWGLILETFNSSPRISKKVKIMDDKVLKRTSLSKFRKYLDIANPNHICFICGKIIEPDDLSIDHVIPWSYMYSDDIWNLVYVHKGCNSRKSNKIPTNESIKNLSHRNAELLMGMRLQHIENKQSIDLEVAIQKNYLKKFWISSRV